MHFVSFDNQISAKLSFTVQTFKEQNSMDMEKYNGLTTDVHYLVHQPQINNGIRATEILKSKSVRSTDDIIGTCVRQSQIVTKTNDASFSSKSVSEIDYLSNTL